MQAKRARSLKESRPLLTEFPKTRHRLPDQTLYSRVLGNCGGEPTEPDTIEPIAAKLRFAKGLRFPGSRSSLPTIFQRPALFLRKISLPVGQNYGTRGVEVEGKICVQIEGLVWKWREVRLCFDTLLFKPRQRVDLVRLLPSQEDRVVWSNAKPQYQFGITTGDQLRTRV